MSEGLANMRPPWKEPGLAADLGEGLELSLSLADWESPSLADRVRSPHLFSVGLL